MATISTSVQTLSCYVSLPEHKQSFQQQLESVGVPVNLASQCAEILVNDDPSKEDLGRSPEELHLVQSAHTWMTAKQG